MRYELRRPADVTELDDIHSVTPDGRVVVAVPETADAITNLIAAGFTIESCEVFDNTSNVG